VFTASVGAPGGHRTTRHHTTSALLPFHHRKPRSASRIARADHDHGGKIAYTRTFLP
jgi:hypothetical protein